MSYEAFGDDDDGHERCRTDEHVQESFVTGAQAMREMLARFVEQGGDAATAASIRANWVPTWGVDPGKLEGPLPSDAPAPTIDDREAMHVRRVLLFAAEKAILEKIAEAAEEYVAHPMLRSLVGDRVSEADNWPVRKRLRDAIGAWREARKGAG